MNEAAVMENVEGASSTVKDLIQMYQALEAPTQIEPTAENEKPEEGSDSCLLGPEVN